MIKRTTMLLMVLAAVILLAAWINGGEVALRPISEPVSTPVLAPASQNVPVSEVM